MALDGKAMAAEVFEAVKTYVDKRIVSEQKIANVAFYEAAQARKLIDAQAAEIRELRFRLSIIDHRTSGLVPNAGKPVKLR